MLFNSYHFLIFFPLVTLVYYVIPKRMRIFWLLAASYYFYMYWSPRYAMIIMACTAVTWAGGILLSMIPVDQANGKLYRKCVLSVCCVITMGVLFFFKYVTFLWDSFRHMMLYFGGNVAEIPFHIVLPVGISFYTFQALSYTVDVYRGRVPAQKNPLKYALFVSFFPQLVAGPIERSDHLLCQIQEIDNIKPRMEMIYNGLLYMLYGFFLKLVLADNLAVFVDSVFERYFLYGSVELLLAAVGFTFQIYCDFSSYSAIAIGAAEVMGFHLMENFHAPYLASSIQDFWRRWHISLSTWFRDYLYIPLGGSRCSKPRHYFNLMITFLVSGLWHGANWTFIIWGGIHGCIINTSSMVSISGQPAGVGYPASKFAVNGITISLARELGKDNIRVNAVAPGVTRTDMVASLPEATVKAISSKIPLGRAGEPEEVANAFLYLASDMASYVTGEILSVDGASKA